MKTLRRCLGSTGLFSLILACQAFAQTSDTNPVPFVTIQATQPVATFYEGTNAASPFTGGTPGLFTVFRNGDTNSTLNVYYQIGGTASNGVDYAEIPNCVTIPAGETSNSIPILPLTNALASAVTTVVLQLAPPPTLNPVNYEIGFPSNAVVDIESTNGVPPPVLGISGPGNGAVFYTPTNIQILANGYGYGMGPTNLAFFAGTNDLGAGMPGPAVPLVVMLNGWSITSYVTWSNPPAGQYPLTVVADFAGGLNLTSAPVNISVLARPPVSYGYITAVLRSQCANSPTPPPPVGATRVGTNYVIMTVADADPLNWTNAQQLVTDADFESLMPLYCGLPKTGCVTDSVQWNIITYDTNGNPVISGCAASGCELHSCEDIGSGPPVIVAQPTNQTVVAGQTVTFSVEASGAAPLIYQWVFDGTNILDGETNAALVLPNVQTNQAGVYQVVIFNSLGGTNSQPVTLTVIPASTPPTNPLTALRIISPANGAVFRAPVNIPILAYFLYPHAPDSYALLSFYDGTNDLGVAQPIATPAPLPVLPGGPVPAPLPVPPTALSTNIYALFWSNAPAGDHVLTAQALIGDSNNFVLERIVSAPVDITVLPSLLPPTNCPSLVSIVATDPIAIEGTNSWTWAGETNEPATWAGWPATACRWFTNAGPRTATFTVRRSGEMTNDLAVGYGIGGTASNGVDYVALPGLVTIPAGERAALITVVPINEPSNTEKTVILTLAPSTNAPPDYFIGFPPRAAAIIVDRPRPVPAAALLSDKCFHLSMPGPDAAWFTIEYSTNLTDWMPLCTNQVIDGSIDFIDPDMPSDPGRFYRAVPDTSTPGD